MLARHVPGVVEKPNRTHTHKPKGRMKMKTIAIIIATFWVAGAAMAEDSCAVQATAKSLHGAALNSLVLQGSGRCAKNSRRRGDKLHQEVHVRRRRVVSPATRKAWPDKRRGKPCLAAKFPWSPLWNLFATQMPNIPRNGSLGPLQVVATDGFAVKRQRANVGKHFRRSLRSRFWRPPSVCQP